MAFTDNFGHPKGLLGRMMLVSMDKEHLPMAEWAMERFELPENGDVIDLGCGGGYNIQRLLKRGFQGKIVGFDISEESVKKARAVNKSELGSQVEIVQGSVENMPFPDENFKLATAFETVFFWPDTRKNIQEVFRVLKPGGRFVVINNYGDPDTDWEKKVPCMKRYTAEQIADFMKSAGFEEPRIEKKDNLFLVEGKKPGDELQKHESEEKGNHRLIASIGAKGTEYENWMSKPVFKIVGGLTAGTAVACLLVKKPVLKVAMGACTAGSAVFLVDLLRIRHALSYNGGKAMDLMQRILMEHLEWDGQGEAADIGCGSGTLTIRMAKTYPDAKITGVDYWGAGWDYSKALCEKNAELEGVRDRTVFLQGDAKQLSFPDETFDALVSNCVYTQIMGEGASDKKKLVAESLRILKKGGAFAIQDYFDREKQCGKMEDMIAFLKDQEISEIHYEGNLDHLLPKVVIRPYCINGVGILWGRK